ncbi:MAG: hypothetical protein U0791_10215 [Gemmataceae bacterium]
MANFSDALGHFERTWTENCPPAQAEELARKVCLASRTAYSEFRALHIEHSDSLPKLLPRLRDLNARAVETLSRIPAPTGSTVEFLEAMGKRQRRLDEVFDTIRGWAHAFSTSEPAPV